MKNCGYQATTEHGLGSAVQNQNLLDTRNRAHLILAALTGLQTCQDLALDDLHPGVPLLVGGGLEVPRLPRQRHNGELQVLLLFCWTEDRPRSGRKLHIEAFSFKHKQAAKKPNRIKMLSNHEPIPTKDSFCCYEKSFLSL